MLHFRNTFAAALSIMLAPSPANATSTKLAPLVPGITRNSACLFPFPIFVRGLRYHPNRCLLLQSLPKALGFLTRQPTPPDPINFDAFGHNANGLSTAFAYRSPCSPYPLLFVFAANYNLRYNNIPLGNGVGKRSLGNSFPSGRRELLSTPPPSCKHAKIGYLSLATSRAPPSCA
ncbi:hypothetical protein JB92DRAFT_2158649 [Gautieria morchelliformis]|nr:hypothetical protein JB92DRAFT_2158649 [Gautieria morchelliformis]